MHALALAAALIAGLAWPLKLVVVFLVVYDGWQHCRHLKHENRTLHYSDQAGWRMEQGAEVEPIEIMASTTLTTKIIFLHLKHKPAQIIASDAMEESEYRYLLVKLKLTFGQEKR